MEDEKKKPGRPRKYVEKRPTWTVRLPASIGEEVTATAKAEGRSISEEIEWRVLQYATMTKLVEQAEALLAEAKRDIEEMRERQIQLSHRSAKHIEAAEARVRGDLEGALRANGYTQFDAPEGGSVWADPSLVEYSIAKNIDRIVFVETAADTLRQALLDRIDKYKTIGQTNER